MNKSPDTIFAVSCGAIQSIHIVKFGGRMKPIIRSTVPKKQQLYLHFLYDSLYHTISYHFIYKAHITKQQGRPIGTNEVQTRLHDK